MSKTETQSEALELAEFFGSMKKSSHRWYDGVPVHEKAAAELRRLDAENKALREKLEAPAVVPFGFALVPVEPTKEMVAAACRDHGYPGGSRSAYVLGYRSMLAAAKNGAAA
jgi:hypothetical protein